jgi:hypothetical protein
MGHFCAVHDLSLEVELAAELDFARIVRSVNLAKVTGDSAAQSRFYSSLSSSGTGSAPLGNSLGSGRIFTGCVSVCPSTVSLTV